MKKRVLKKFPDAWAHSWADCWVIYVPNHATGNVTIGQGKTAALAWKSAARAINVRRFSLWKPNFKAL